MKKPRIYLDLLHVQKKEPLTAEGFQRRRPWFLRPLYPLADCSDIFLTPPPMTGKKSEHAQAQLRKMNTAALLSKFRKEKGNQKHSNIRPALKRSPRLFVLSGKPITRGQVLASELQIRHVASRFHFCHVTQTIRVTREGTTPRGTRGHLVQSFSWHSGELGPENRFRLLPSYCSLDAKARLFGEEGWSNHLAWLQLGCKFGYNCH